MKYPVFVVALGALALTLIAGCGGGGGGGPAGGGPAGAEFSIFVTDSFRDDYDRVWATIHQVELLDAAGSARVALSDAAGKVVDIRTLRDATGERFTLVGAGSVPPGTYSAVRLTLGQTFSLVPRGGTTAEVVQVAADLPRDGAGRPLVQFTLKAPKAFGTGGASELVVDFDLASFALVGGRIRPALREAAASLLRDHRRHEPGIYTGMIVAPAGTPPNRTFSLLLPNDATIQVATTGETAVYNADGSPSPTITHGKRAQVEGVMDLTAGRLLASEVKILPSTEPLRAHVVGMPSDINAAAGTFTVTIGRAEGFAPRRITVAVTTSASTRFHLQSGLDVTKDEFFAALAAGGMVKVDGNYDPGTNALAAVRAKHQHMDGARPHDVEAKGKPASVKTAEKTFDLNPVSEYEGFAPSGTSVHVTVTAETKYLDKDGGALTADAAFTRLAGTGLVRVEGAYTVAANTIAARELQLLDDKGTPDPDGSAAGIPIEVDKTAKKFTIKPVTEHTGFDVKDGRVRVTTTTATTYRNVDDTAMTSTQFFDRLAEVTNVKVEGVYRRAADVLEARVCRVVTAAGDKEKVTATGKPTEIVSADRRFVIDPVTAAVDFTPPGDRVKVAGDATTVYKNVNGAAITASAFFSALPSTFRVRVEGKYTKITNTITATSAEILERSVVAVGKPAAIVAGERVFDLDPVTDPSGFNPPDNKVKVTEGADPTYQNNHSQSISAAVFFEKLPGATKVRVEGRYTGSNNTIKLSLGRLVEFEADASATGTPIEVDAANKRFTLSPVGSATGFWVGHDRVGVKGVAATVYKNKAGDTVAAAAFFDLIKSAKKAKAVGRYKTADNAITASEISILE